MKRINFATLIAALTLGLSVTLGVATRGGGTTEPPPASSAETKTVRLEDREKTYLLRELEGRLAVFNEDGTIYRRYDLNVGLLPEYDRRRLSEGILVGESELRARIEDYTS